MTDQLKTPTPAGVGSTTNSTAPLTPEQVAAATGGRVLSDEEAAKVNAPAVVETAVLSLTPEEQALQDKLRQGSGEADLGGGWTYIPYITVDNRMVNYELAGGQKVVGRCQPQFVINEKDDEEYTTTPFLPEFEGVILKFMNKAKRKPIMDQTKKMINKHPYFQSLEFKSFQSQIYLRQKNAEGKMQWVKPMGYQDVKACFGEENELWGVVYFLMVDPSTGQLEDTARKAEFKGMSRSILYDYMIARRDYSVSSVITKFGVVLKEDTGNPYNCLSLANTGRKADPLAKVVAAQEELNAMIDGNLEPKINVEQLPAPSDDCGHAYAPDHKNEAKEVEDTEIKIQGIPF